MILKSDNLIVAAARSVERPSRVWMALKKTAWRTTMEIQIRPEQARAMARALLSAQREVERTKKARWRTRRKDHN